MLLDNQYLSKVWFSFNFDGYKISIYVYKFEQRQQKSTNKHFITEIGADLPIRGKKSEPRALVGWYDKT